MAMTRQLALLVFLFMGCRANGDLLGVVVTEGGPADDGFGAANDDAATNDGPSDAGPVSPTDDSTPPDDASANLDAGVAAEAATEAATNPDGGPMQLVPFGPASIVAATTDPNSDNEDPSMTGDSLELYFMTTRSGNPDIWVTVRSSATAAWGAATPVKELNTTVDEGAPGVSLDGLTIWFCRSVVYSRPQIWVSTRAARGAPWGPPTAVGELDTAGRQLEPVVDESSLLMFFASDRADGGGYDLYLSSRATVRSFWSVPQEIPVINSTSSRANDWDPFVGAYGLEVWFASTRSGGGDLFWSQRASLTDPFAPPVPLKELNTPSAEGDPTLSADFRQILFASNRSGRYQIYEAWR